MQLTDVNQMYQFAPKRQYDGFYGHGFEQVDIDKSGNAFGPYPEHDRYQTPYENQGSYPSRQHSERTVYYREVINWWQKNLIAETARLFPIEITDKLKHYNTVLSTQPGIADITDIGAPKVDMGGVKSETTMTTMQLRGVQGTFWHHISDDNDIGQAKAWMQYQAMMLRMENASTVSVISHLVERMENPMWAEKLRHTTEGIDVDEVWDEFTSNFNGTEEVDFFQKLDKRRQKRLRRYGGDAPELLISDDVESFRTLYREENISKGRIGDMKSADRNKSDTGGIITSISDYTRVTKLPEMILADGKWLDALQTRTIYGGYDVVGQMTNTVSGEYKTDDYNIRISDSETRQLVDMTIDKCSQYSYLFDENGQLLADGNKKIFKAKGGKQLELEKLVSNDDLFWYLNLTNNKLSVRNRFYQTFIQRNYDLDETKNIYHTDLAYKAAVSAYDDMIRETGITSSNEIGLWTYFHNFMATKRLVRPEQIATIFVTNPVYKAGMEFKWDGVNGGHGVFESFKHIYDYANAKGDGKDPKDTNDRKNLREWCQMMISMYNHIKETFQDVDKKEDYPLTNLNGLRGTLYSDATYDEIDAILHQLDVFKHKWSIQFAPDDDTVYKGYNGVTLPFYTADETQAVEVKDKNNAKIGDLMWFEAKWGNPLVEGFGDVFKTECRNFFNEFRKKCGGERVTCKTIMVYAYLTSKIEQKRIEMLPRRNIRMPYAFLKVNPAKEVIGVSAIGIKPAGTLGRYVAFTESNLYPAVEQGYTRFDYEAYFGPKIIDTNNSTYDDNIHIIKYFGGDTTTPTNWDYWFNSMSRNDKHPKCFIVVIPHFWIPPRNFLDISGVSYSRGIGQSRLIPGFLRYNAMWKLEAPTNHVKECVEPYIRRKLPGQIARNPQLLPRNYWCGREARFEFNIKTKEYEHKKGEGGFKNVSIDFFTERYSATKRVLC